MFPILVAIARAAIHFVSSADRSLNKRIAVPQSSLGGRALGRDKEKGMVICVLCMLNLPTVINHLWEKADIVLYL